MQDFNVNRYATKKTVAEVNSFISIQSQSLPARLAALTCEIPFSTFETRSRFLPPYHVVRDRDRDFYLPIMWFEIEIFEIEIFHHWISCFETRSRFFIIESRSSRRDREFSSLNLEIRDEIEMLFISFVNKFQTPEQRAENDISLKKMCIQR